jgi:hypothetical protein
MLVIIEIKGTDYGATRGRPARRGRADPGTPGGASQAGVRRPSRPGCAADATNWNTRTPDRESQPGEAAEALQSASEIIDAATRLLPSPGFF